MSSTSSLGHIVLNVRPRRLEHVAGASIYFSDPDGIELETCVEHTEETWRGEKRAVRTKRPIPSTDHTASFRARMTM